jgi:hypothetical protein
MKVLGRLTRPKVFENRVLRRIFGSEWNEVVGKWKRLHKEEHYGLYYDSVHTLVSYTRVVAKWHS